MFERGEVGAERGERQQARRIQTRTAYRQRKPSPSRFGLGQHGRQPRLERPPGVAAVSRVLPRKCTSLKTKRPAVSRRAFIESRDGTSVLAAEILAGVVLQLGLHAVEGTLV